MKVIVLGGYGVFGARLVRLLRRDGHHIWVAGRDALGAKALADTMGAESLLLDRNGDLSTLAVLATEAGAEVLVDAAGPFHAYGEDPYRLARTCLQAGLHYLDLADDPAFCAGIGALDALARTRRRVALSGVSSVPGLSSAVVAALAAGMESIESIDSAILPGNRAPRGRSVVASILSQAGQHQQLWQDARWRAVRGWSEPRAFVLEPGLRRHGWRIAVPDLVLFPGKFGAASVGFYAGMELALMNTGLAALAWVRAKVGFAMPDGLVVAVRWAALLLWPFGTARGGMVVEVRGRAQGLAVLRRWTLVAEAGEGPFVPAVTARSILRGPMPAPGARPCLAEVPLPAVEAAMADLAIRCRRDETWVTPLFLRVLGAAFTQLPAPVRASHEVTAVAIFSGRAEVGRGSSPFARLIAAVFRFPVATPDVAVTVTKTRTDSGESGCGEIWERCFGGRRFRSHLTEQAGRMSERFGPFVFTLDVMVRDGELHYPVASGRVFGLPIPRALLPVSRAREFEHDGMFHFDVSMYTPFGGLIVRYRGCLRRASRSSV